MEPIHRSEIFDNEWRNTSFVRFDGKEEYREKPGYQNRHAIFEKDSDWGKTHVDKHNPLDFSQGTLNHSALYVNEQTGIPEPIAKISLVAIALYGIYKIFKYLDED